MQLFFATVNEGFALLTEEDSGHCIRVMRMRTGDEISLTDGTGNLYTGILTDPHPKKCIVRITGIRHDYGRRNYSLHVAIAPTKNIERFEWFLEKATEIGIDEITPVLCERSERRIIKNERLNKILVSAMKQSLKAYLPKLNEATAFDKFISACETDQRFTCTMDTKSLLKNNVTPDKNTLVLIGPEGDFTKNEILLSQENQFLPVSLGNSRLRTETAGIVATTIVSLLNQ